MTGYTTYRSFHGSGIAKAILFYWPGTSKEVAEALEDEMGNMEWPVAGPSKERARLKSKFLRERLGAPIK